MFKIFPTGVAVDTSKIFYLRVPYGSSDVVCSSYGDASVTIADFKTSAKARAYLKELVDELNAEKEED